MYFILLPKYIFKTQEYLILAVIFGITYVFPLLLLALLKYFNMINSYHMVTIEERKFPTLLFIAISYIIGNWLYKSSEVDILSLFYFGYGLALIFTYALLHFKIKVSLHSVGISGLLGFFIYFSYYYKINLIPLLAVLFILGGLIGSTRLLLKAHKLHEVFLGYTIGAFAQFIVFFIYIM